MAKVKNPASMTIEAFRVYLGQQNSQPASEAPKKGKSAKKAKPAPTTMSADDFRADYVDTEESPLQKRCVKWFRRQYPNLLLYAVPNAAKRSITLAATMKAEGMEPGVPDLHLAFPTSRSPGLYLEMKTRKGKPSDDQIRIHAYLVAVGYDVAIPRSFEEFQRIVNTYLKP